MHSIDVSEASAQFAELLRRVQAGEEVLLVQGSELVARVIPAFGSGRKPRFGAARGLLSVRDDFDEPLEDFAPYTE